MRSLIETTETIRKMIKWRLGRAEGLYGPKTGESIIEIFELGTQDDIKHRKKGTF